MLSHSLKLCMGIGLCLALTFVNAQITTADNGLTATGTAPNKNVALGGTLNNAATSIDFGSSNSSSNFLIKKGTSNYFYIDNNGNIAVGHVSPAERLDVTGFIKSSSGFKYNDGIYGANLETYGTYSRIITNSSTDGLMLHTSKNPSSIKLIVNNGGRGIMLHGNSANLLFLDGSGNALGGIGNADGTGNLTLLYSSAINTRTEGARLTTTGNFGIGITSPAADLHVIQKSASQTGMIVKSNSDAQTTNTFEVQDASGTGVLKVRGTQNGTYAQAAVSINQGNKTNNPAFAISNIGSGLSGIVLGGSDGGSVILEEFDLSHSPTWTYTNKHAKWRVINNAFDGASTESFSFQHFDQPATMTLMKLQGQASQTGDMLQIKNSGGTDIFKVKATGGGYFADNVGINVTSPTAKLHTNGTVRFEGLTNDNAQTRVLVTDANGNVTYRDASSLGGGGSISGTTNYIAKYSSGTAIANSLLFDNGTSVGIGTVNINETGYKLFVETGIRTRKVKVDQAIWSDYVFEQDYQLPSLAEVEQFIQHNKHLPGVPTAKEVETDGLDLGNNQAVLLKKIEELTLYVIQLQKEVDTLKSKIK